MRAAARPSLHQPLSSTGRPSAPVPTHIPYTSALTANSDRFAMVIQHLKAHFSGEGRLQTPELFSVIFSLAKSVDFSLSINDIPSVAPALPSLIKEVYCCRNDSSLQSAIMVLLIASKRACSAGWFPSSDAAEVTTMTNEFSCSFCLNAKIVSEAEHVISIISKLISRFYPRLKLCSLIASFEAKVGYDILLSDFHISRDKQPSEVVRLVVAQGDNLETSSCIITPPYVSFLINGKGIVKRTSASLDNGPQYPTDITKLLKYGTNIIQAIGYFSNMYIIAIAHMSEAMLSPPILEDYDRSIAREVTADSDIIEGPSKVSLNCPISCTRINIPVKGYLCKHHQCFDFDNFMEVNSMRPIWRCPCCYQPVCFTDLRIDQSMNKVIREVSPGVADVVLSLDGSWTVLNEQNEAIAHLHKPHEAVHVAPEENECGAIFNRTDVIDLSMELDDGIGADNHKAEDAKPYKADVDLWTRAYSPTTSYGLSASVILQGNHMPGTPGPSAPISLIKPVTADAITVVTESNMDSNKVRSTAISTGNVRQPLIRLVDRIPNAVQALPVQAACSPQRTPVINSTSLDPTNFSTSFQPITLGKPIQQGQNPGNWNTGYQRMLNSPTDSSYRKSPFAQNPPIHSPRQIRSSSIQRLPSLEVQDMNTANTRSSSLQRLPSLEVQDMNTANTRTPLTHHQRGSDNSRPLAQFLSIKSPRTPYSRVPLPSVPLNSSHIPPTKVSQQPTRSINPVVDAITDPQTQQSAPQIAFPLKLQPSNTVLQTNMPGTSQPDLASDQSWRPTGRMRGSLTGDAYSAALSQYLTVSTPVVAPPAPPDPLIAIIANSMLARGHESLPANMSKGGDCSLASDANTQ